MLVPDFLVSPSRAAILYADWEEYRFRNARPVKLPPAPAFHNFPEQPAPAMWMH